MHISNATLQISNIAKKLKDNKSSLHVLQIYFAKIVFYKMQFMFYIRNTKHHAVPFIFYPHIHVYICVCNYHTLVTFASQIRVFSLLYLGSDLINSHACMHTGPEIFKIGLIK